ncbi:unnamed protein product [Nezara viridula]|uniref:Uncharacterized protein n=1 Tax=Nezara viridula TaxID=85310 RepID=A0A9P0E6Y7_NEZVI|nr:unnamed protein product [Nezara viridula]
MHNDEKCAGSSGLNGSAEGLYTLKDLKSRAQKSPNLHGYLIASKHSLSG